MTAPPPRPPAADTVRLDDPKALRALAHPARYQVVNLLFRGEVLTATQAAERCDITPSAMSYHLRALERWGIVERVEGSGDGRERPWRATGRHLQLAGAGRANPALARTLFGRFVAELDAAVDEFVGSGRMHESHGAGAQRSTVRLTPARSRALSEEIQALLERYETDDETDDAVTWELFWAALPRPGPTPPR